jgi:hypothetical protein
LIVTVFSCNDSDLVIDSVLKTQRWLLRTLAINGTTYASGVNFTSANLTFGAMQHHSLELQDGKGENVEK